MSDNFHKLHRDMMQLKAHYRHCHNEETWLGLNILLCTYPSQVSSEPISDGKVPRPRATMYFAIAAISFGDTSCKSTTQKQFQTWKLFPGPFWLGAQGHPR